MRKRLNQELLVLILATAALCLLQGCEGIADPVARETLLDDLGATTFTVYPAYIRRRAGAYGEPTAERLADFLCGRDLAEVVVSDEQVPITGPWGHNQARMLRESAEAFAAYLQDHPIRTDYALLAEYLFGRDAAVGIHCYVLDGEGVVAYAVLLNDHWPPFAEADPRTVDDCTEVLIEVLGASWQR
jgi:hypothetical protein